MITLCVMCLGIIAGRYFFSDKFKTANGLLQTICTVLLIFSMGVTLGKKDNFFDILLSLGFDSFLYFAFPTAISVILVYFFSNRLLCDRKANETDDFNQGDQ